MPCVIGAYCSASAYAIELSDATFSASAALIGAAMFALTRDIAARSGSSSPARAVSSSRVSFLNFCCSLIDTSCLSRFLGRAGLVDRGRYDRVQLARNGHARRVLVEAPLDDLSV